MCRYTYTCRDTSVHVCKYTYKCVNTRTHAQIHVHMRNKRTCTCTRTHTHTYKHMRTYRYTSVDNDTYILGFATGTRVPGYPAVRPGPGIEMCLPVTRKISQNRNFYHGLQNETPQHVTFPSTAYNFNLAFAFEFMKVIACCANINATHCH